MDSISDDKPTCDSLEQNQPRGAGREHSSLANKTKKVTRRDPEKRRLQNQKAQKRYREKRKRHLIDLENLVASAGPGSGTNSRKNDVEPGKSADAGDLSTPATARNSRRSYIASETAELLPTDWPMLPFEQYESVLGPAAFVPCQLTNDSPWGAATSASWTVDFFACGCKIPHIEVRTRKSAGHPEHRLAAFNFFPDPYMNTLRIERLCIVEAMRHNCSMLGITEYMWCSDDTISPFFRPTTNLLTDGIVHSVQSIFQTLKPDMRPNREQITVCHHPYIDIMPFPTVRKNLINNLDSIDEDEFFYDALNGLICWGGVGVGKRNNTGAGSGTPWDVRSWEAKEWFLRKWWFIVGGEEGELTRQSRWWRSFRGEDSEDMVQLPGPGNSVIPD